MRIVILGLPGSGKTTLGNLIKHYLETKVHRLNADIVREQNNDWDFSNEGRMRQSKRLKEMSHELNEHSQWVIVDFVCPTEVTRETFSADMVIWMDTIKESRFPDTDSIFEPCQNADLIIADWEYDVEDIVGKIKKFELENMFNFQKPTTQMLGRWQPWHKGHQTLFKRALEVTGQVLIMVRDVGGIIGKDAGGGRTNSQTDNPFEFNEVKERIRLGLAEEGFTYGKEYIIELVPNIVDISYGRGVGYTFTEHDLGEEIHSISATKIREEMREQGELNES